MTAAKTYVSFLIRLWREETPEVLEQAAGWQGEVEHIQSGRRWTFSTLDELLGFLRQFLTTENRATASLGLWATSSVVQALGTGADRSSTRTSPDTTEEHRPGRRGLRVVCSPLRKLPRT